MKAPFSMSATAILLMLISIASGDIAKLKNGSRIEGQIMKETADGIEIKTMDITVRLSKDRVASVQRPRAGVDE